jgi:flagellum-specific ATP synthase
LLPGATFLDGCRQAASQVSSLLPSGHLTRINGLVMEASGLKLPLGSSCRIVPPGGSPIEAEVVGFNGERLFLMPSEDVYGLSPGARVVALETPNQPPQNRSAAPRTPALDRPRQTGSGRRIAARPRPRWRRPTA